MYRVDHFAPPILTLTFDVLSRTANWHTSYFCPEEHSCQFSFFYASLCRSPYETVTQTNEEMGKICNAAYIAMATWWQWVRCEWCREMFEVQSSAARLLILQCDSGDMHSELIACARYIIINEHNQTMAEDVNSAGIGIVHMLFIVQLPRIAGGCFIGFQVHVCCLWISCSFVSSYISWRVWVFLQFTKILSAWSKLGLRPAVLRYFKFTVADGTHGPLTTSCLWPCELW